MFKEEREREERKVGEQGKSKPGVRRRRLTC